MLRWDLSSCAYTRYVGALKEKCTCKKCLISEASLQYFNKPSLASQVQPEHSEFVGNYVTQL